MGKETLCKCPVDFRIEKEAGEVPKASHVQNMQMGPCVGASVGRRSVVVTHFTKGIKTPLVGKAHRTPSSVGGNSRFPMETHGEGDPIHIPSHATAPHW